MYPFRCLRITVLSGAFFVSLATGCAEQRQSTRHLTESWPSPAPQAQAVPPQNEETTTRNQEAAQPTDKTVARE